MLLDYRNVSRRRIYNANQTRASIVARKVEARTGREPGRGDRIAPTSRHARALKYEVINLARAQWRNFDWCMTRVCNSRYQAPLNSAA